MADEVATLIGDVVRSRGSSDRGGLHDSLTRVLGEVNAGLRPVTPLRLTVGDEYQGAFATVREAARAALLLRVALLPRYDVRQGLSWGRVTVLQEEPRVEDGPGWWAARDAVHVVEEAERRAATRRRRTAFRPAADAEGAPEEAWVDGLLLLRDELVSGLSERSVSVLRGLLAGSTQQEIAAELGISPSAVSQRVRGDGLGALLATHEMLADESRGGDR